MVRLLAVSPAFAPKLQAPDPVEVKVRLLNLLVPVMDPPSVFPPTALEKATVPELCVNVPEFE